LTGNVEERNLSPTQVYNMEEKDPAIQEIMWLLHNISKDDEGHGSQHFTLISRVPCLLLVANMDTGMDTVVA